MTKETGFVRLDQSMLYNIYRDWPKYIEDALKFSCSLDRDHEHYKSIFFCGMGGSATSNDVLQQIMENYGQIPSFVLRGQMMPSYVDKSSLVIINSVSGNTREALQMMKEALQRNSEVVCISSGGLLERYAYDSKCKHIKIPNLGVPRASLPYLLIPSLNIINPFLKLCLEDEVRSIAKNVGRVFDENLTDVPEAYNTSKRIATFLLNGFPYCYASPFLLPAATRFKNSLNENAKLHCIRDSILEASHNDIVPFTYGNISTVPKVLHVRWKYDNSTIDQRFDKVHSFLNKVVHPVMEITITDRSLLHALISAIYILDISTLYMAIAKNTDPSPTPAIEILKGV